MIEKLFSDSDDVLVDWKGYVGKRLPLISRQFNMIDPRENIRLLNTLERDTRKSIMREYYQMYPDTFRNLDITEAFIPLMTMYSQLINNGIKVEVLTALGDDHPDSQQVIDDKIACLSRHMIGFGLPITFEFPQLSEDKQSYAKDGYVLIDDFHRNCQQFEQAGGKAIWHRDAESSVRELIKLCSAFPAFNA